MTTDQTPATTTETPAQGEPAAAAAPVETPSAAATAPEVHTFSHEALNERLDRAKRGALRDAFGTDDVDAIKARLAAADAAEAEAEKRRQAELSELEREREARAKAEALAAEMEQERDDARFKSMLSGYCAELGVTGLGYAEFMVVNAVEALPEGETLDTKAYLAELLQDAQHAAALGATPPAVQAAPATTTSTQAEPGAPEPGRNATNVDAMSMNAEQWEQHARRYNLR